MDSRPPPSIIVAVVIVAGVTVTGIAGSIWALIGSTTGRSPLSGSSMGGVLGLLWCGVFVVRVLRRRRSIRVPGIAVGLSLAGIFAILTVALAAAPGIEDRAWAVAMITTFALLAALVGLSLLRPSARTWLDR